MLMVRMLGYAFGILLFTTMAFALADIPTRYSGAFPSTANISNISGTFTGASLSLRGTGRKGGTVAGQYSCTRLSNTQTRCAGTLKAVSGTYSDRHTVTITWAGGQPVSMSGTH